jgi:hypothetical protein
MSWRSTAKQPRPTRPKDPCSRSAGAPSVRPYEQFPWNQLLQLPDGASVPKRVQRITGLDDDALVLGATAEAAWSRVLEAARVISDKTTGRCPAVIHFSRYEERHLRWLHVRAGLSSPFPFRIVCTHTIARRLLPELPRRGLRAVD